MIAPYQQLDRRFSTLKRLARTIRPQRGWIRAIRESLGMTTAQLARRLGVSQARASYLEHAETNGNITLKTLERTAEALGCRVVYVLIPERPLAETLRNRASAIADKQLTSVEHSMRLEAQEVSDKTAHTQAHQQLVTELLRRPARLWNE
jgi:predicted DNA-binding mobile mystery protein A